MYCFILEQDEHFLLCKRWLCLHYILNSEKLTHYLNGINYANTIKYFSLRTLFGRFNRKVHQVENYELQLITNNFKFNLKFCYKLIFIGIMSYVTRSKKSNELDENVSAINNENIEKFGKIKSLLRRKQS